MIKFVYCVKKKDGMSSEEFRRYWEEDHGPLVRKQAEILKAKKYVQSHTLDSVLNDYARQPRNAKEAYDGITEIWWESEEELTEILKTPEGQEANAILKGDEAKFVDLEQSSVFFTKEITIFDF